MVPGRTHDRVRSGGDKILTVGADGTHLRLLSATTDFIEGWSPDRTRVLAETERRIPSGDNGNGGFNADLWVLNTDGTGRRRIFRQRCCIDTSPRAIWSPDGTRIAVAASGGPDAGFYVVNADGTRLRRLVSDGIIAVREGFPLLAWQAIRRARGAPTARRSPTSASRVQTAPTSAR